MATIIFFWNPSISSFTREAFEADFANRTGFNDWSIAEPDAVTAPGADRFYMVMCGVEHASVVARGQIVSPPYEGRDWSPRGRRPVYYVDLETSECINPWGAGSPSLLLAPGELEKAVPGFNWQGGHSGRLLDAVAAVALDEAFDGYVGRCGAQLRKRRAYWRF